MVLSLPKSSQRDSAVSCARKILGMLQEFKNQRHHHQQQKTETSPSSTKKDTKIKPDKKRKKATEAKDKVKQAQTKPPGTGGV